MRSVLGIIGTLWFLVASTACGASVNLVQDFTFAPPTADSIIQIEFADVTGDGIPEIAVLDSGGIVLYDFVGDSILCHLPDFFPGSIRKLTIADFTGDHIADVAYISATFVSSSQSLHVVRVFDGASGFSLVATDTLESHAGFETWYGVPCSAFDAVDLDNDSLNELLLSFGGYEFYWMGTTLLLDPLVDSVLWTLDSAVSDVHVFTDDRGSNVYCSDYWFYWVSIPYFYEAQEIGSAVTHIRPDGSVAAAPVVSGGWACPYIRYTYTEHLNHVGDIGAMVLGSDRPNLAIWYDWWKSCYESNDPEDSGAWHRGFGYAMYRIESPDTLSLLWVIEDPGVKGPMVYHPMFPGYFIAQWNLSLSLFRGSDGARLADVALPQKQYQWTKAFADSQPRLVTYSDSNVTIYHVDISTGVDDETPATLPDNFSLGAPYPNPFNGSIVLPISNDHRQRVRIDIVNMLGQRIATVFDEELGAGEKSITWNAGDKASGVYFVRAVTESGGDSKKVIYLK